MQKIDKALLKRRSEHNDGDLSTLQEISLHQFDIEKIENLDVYCRQLEIILLQNNQIAKIENLHKLKRLRYLNLAINNITVIEGLGGCESLEKLDLTVNFIDDVRQVGELLKNIFLSELYLVGNPCFSKAGYRDYVIGCLPGLKTLDSKEIKTSERIVARQVFLDIERDIELDQLNNPQPKYIQQSEEISSVPLTQDQLELKRNEFQSKVSRHTPQARIDAARDLAKLRNKEKPVAPAKVVSTPSIADSMGRVMQRNEGKWKYNFSTRKSSEYHSGVLPRKQVCLSVEISKFLDTSFIQVDVRPTNICIHIKGKLLQLMLPVSVVEGKEYVVCERSRLTGSLLVIMCVDESCDDHSSLNSGEMIVVKGPVKPAAPLRNRRFERLGIDVQECVDYRNIVGEIRKDQVAPASAANPVGGIITDKKYVESDYLNAVSSMTSFIDNPDVPPLCM